ncbi:calcium-independent phospholipase A2-gamma-like [Entelurus aequoreus]|uniref:calcium-independent phospholipase A2-gamma-like n=1 Tax=Entelurus aequoreus TaxID=161455 RepID=UPI002B1D76C8|nr:calcium-independent phospholipase A2-gamma-like [Entelurus aequoreus]XP_061917360.1 calcium-independent phospholipase A2-gamma-like [Entelurus aequoreus]
MSHRWCLSTFQRSLHVQHPQCVFLSRLYIFCSRGAPTRKAWRRRTYQLRQKLGIHTGGLCLNSSTPRWSAGLSQHMSRVRNTLDTVSKAVTPTDLLSKITRLKAQKPGTNVGPAAEKGTAAASKSTSVTALEAAATTSSSQPHNATQATDAVATVPAQESKEIKLRRVTPEEPQQSSNGKQTQALFHPSSLSVNLDQTYNYVAHHINSYFDSSTKTQQKDHVEKPPQSSDLMCNTPPLPAKKGFGHYLAYSTPTVQAFVGSYITPLVPKFRTGESKSATDDAVKLEDAPGKQAEVSIIKEQKVEDEKAKKLLLQREKIIARVSVDNRTRALVQALHRATDVRVYISRVEDLSYHLLEFPETCGVAVKEKVIPCLLRLQQAKDPGLREAVREALTLVGYHKAVKGRGIRILSIDGGGLRGLLALQTLHKLEALTGKPIYKLFDYICGVSTGAILGFMLGVFQLPTSECDDLYRKLGSDVFKQNVIVGTVKMGWSHAFYNSEAWESILREKMGSHILVETSRNPECPKVAAVSTIVNRGTPLKAYVFRNYNLLPGVRSHYLGGSQHQLWQAIRATSAAPGYFQEFLLGSDLHQDGGLLINNPTALAIHECKCLWPNTPLECVVSLGTGRLETTARNSATYTSLKTKITNVISSATDTEEVHAMLDGFLPADTYFRFNPFVSEDISIDDNRREKLSQLQAEGVRYLERNEEKLKKAAGILTREKDAGRRLADWLKTRTDMYKL